ncbi:hypothetical protein ACHAXN_009040, partial [Cyclotella atomus]
SIDASHHRESEREDLWRPRMEGVAGFIADTFSKSDVIMLQEWWFDDSFAAIFDEATGHLFHRITERRPGAIDGHVRDDGLCCLIRKSGKLEPVSSHQVSTAPTRISQLVHCRERGGAGRDVYLANSHLSFPGHADPFINDQRQANEAKIIIDALSTAAASAAANNNRNSSESLQIICGDFNSNSHGSAAMLCESNNYVNCASAAAQQMLTSVGGRINLGVTHCNHLGEHVSVDHVFLRLNKPKSNNDPTAEPQSTTTGIQTNNRCAALAMGYLDTKGSRILNVQKENLMIEGKQVLSDHRPVTVSIDWPRVVVESDASGGCNNNFTMPLDPLEPAWGVVQ